LECSVWQVFPQQPVPLQQLPAPVPQTAAGRTAQAQLPELQVAPAGQAIPQSPQLAGSLATATQAPGEVPQTLVLAGQLHVPDAQLAPVAQTWPQAPQLAVSVAAGTHWVPQTRFGATQVQTPLRQSSYPPQDRRQALQFEVSFVRFAHCAPGPVQGVAPASQAQAPPVHVPRPQNRRQLPQWNSSVWRSTQAPPQSVWPVGHSQTPAAQDPP
jgi:hypothetical protein